GDSRRDFVGDQIERKIPRRDESARPDRNTPPHPAVTVAALRDIERKHFSDNSCRFLSRKFHGVEQSRNLSFCKLNWFAGLDDEHVGQFILALVAALQKVLEHRFALPRR